MTVALRWSGVAQLLQQVLQFAISIALARLLSPLEFGVFGMAVVFAGLFMTVADLGLGSALVQSRHADPGWPPPVLLASMLAAGAFAAALLGIGTLLAALYREPQVLGLTRILAIGVFLSGVSAVPRAALLRGLDVGPLALVELASLVVGGAVGCGLAMTGFGAASLAWQSVATAAAGLLLLLAVSARRPRPPVRRGALAELWRFGLPLTGFNTLNFLVRNGDNFLVGRYIGAPALGIYARAYGLMLLPIQAVSGAVGRVAFPMLSRLSADTGELKASYLRAVRLVAFFTFPAMAGLLVTADHFVLTTYGPDWRGVVPILRVLCALGIIQSVGTTTGWVFQATGRTDKQLVWALGAGTLNLAAIALGVWAGSVMTVAVFYAVTSGVILLYPAIAYPGKLIGLRFPEMLGTLSSTALCTALMAGAVWACDAALPAVAGHGVSLAIDVGVGTAAYLVLARRLHLPQLADVSALLRGGGEALPRPAL
jgi:O-antigen/teichoic acid export membrane protein